jgi:hypothetical protein
MTLTRRQTLIGAAATVAAAALPAMKAKESWSIELEETDDGRFVVVSERYSTDYHITGSALDQNGHLRGQHFSGNFVR